MNDDRRLISVRNALSTVAYSLRNHTSTTIDPVELDSLLAEYSTKLFKACGWLEEVMFGPDDPAQVERYQDHISYLREEFPEEAKRGELSGKVPVYKVEREPNV